MKYCEDYAALLDLFVDGELPPEEMARVQAHLADCPGCQAYVDDALAMRAGFPDVEETTVPEGFAEGVMERVRAESGRERKTAALRRRSFRRWAGTLGALAACCALIVLVRTGPGGLSGGDSAAMVTASSGDAPAGGAMDTGGAVESQENGMAPQMEIAEAAEAAPQEEGQAETRMTAACRAEAADDSGEEKAAGPSADEDLPMSLCLTTEEAGDLLENYTPVQETASERRYELTGQEYQALLAALGRQSEDRTAERVLVVVTGIH